MTGRLFDPEAQARLLRNKNVLRISETTITYCPSFKVEAVRAELAGKPPQLIFIDAGFDLDLIGRQRPKRCLSRWRAIFTLCGEAGLRSDQRGRTATVRPAEAELTVEEKLRRAQARVRYLEKENELLKKLDAIERSVVDRPSEKYARHRASASLGMDLSLAVIGQVTTRLGDKEDERSFDTLRPPVLYQHADRGIVQSMSRKSNCLDNAPVESFFGHMKDELDLTCCYSLDQVRAVVDEYTYHYNHHRYQWKRKKMAPVEYRNHLLAG